MDKKLFNQQRTQCVCVDGVDSPSLFIASSGPHRSVLGVPLFMTYINDVVTCISNNSKVNMFADDIYNIVLYRVIKTTSDYTHLQQDIKSISTCI